MLWLIFSFLTAFFESLKDVFSKKGLQIINEYLLASALSFFALLFLFPFLFFIKIPTLNSKFFLALIVSGSLNVITTILYIKAIKSSDLSLTVPLLTFTPVFLLITSPLIVGEFPTLLGIISILLIFLGSYLLNISEKQKGILMPLKSLLKDKGAKFMLIVAFIWSITSNFDKIGVLNSSPLFWAIAANFFVTVLLFILLLTKAKNTLTQIAVNLKILFLIGLCTALTLIFQMQAINLTLVAYVISIKRTSAIFSVLFGHLIFKEKNLKERLLGVVIMVLGVLGISLF